MINIMDTTIKPCLFAFDMNSLFARTYSVKTKDGEPAGPRDFFEGTPIFALQSTLSLMQKEFNYIHNVQGITCTHLVLVFDHGGKNFRHALDPSYKSNRPPKPDSWKAQEELLYDFFHRLGFPCLKVEGVEADDVIATLSTSLSMRDIFTIIFSGDKDLMSLCDHHIALYAGRDNKLYDDVRVAEKFGLPCDRLLDYLTIVGDSADGVKGIPDLGPGAALKILSEMPLADLLNDTSALSRLKIRGHEKIAQWINGNKEQVSILQQLIQLKRDVPLNTNLKSLRMQQAHSDNTMISRFIQSRNITSGNVLF